MEKVGGERQYLVIDLASEQWDVRLLPHAIYERYLGGEALAWYLWSQYADSDNVSEPEGPICFTVGALTASDMPCSSTLSMVGMSPATNQVQSATATTSLADKIVSCGWQAIVIIHVARRQMSLHISSNDVLFKPSERLIGKGTLQSAQLLDDDCGAGILTIGPAGERGVSSAALIHDQRAIERFGFGALLGKKHIKALVVAQGNFSYRPYDPQLFEQTKAVVAALLTSSTYATWYRKEGALFLLRRARQMGFAAIENVTKRTDPRLFHLGSDECSRKFALEDISCDGCFLNCHRSVMRPGGKDAILPDTHEMMALGSNLGNWDPALVIQWRSRCIDLGLHPVSSGMVIGSVLFASEDRVPINIVKETPLLIEQLSRNALVCSDASQIQGRPMAPHDPRGSWGQALLLGLHEDYPLVPETVLSWVKPEDLRGKAEWVVLQENCLAILRSAGLCDQLLTPLIFEGSRKSWLQASARVPKLVSRLLSLQPIAQLVFSFTGVCGEEHQIRAVGRRAIQMKQSSGSIPAPIPERFLLDPKSNHASDATVPYRKLVDRYQFLRTLDLAHLEKE